MFCTTCRKGKVTINTKWMVWFERIVGIDSWMMNLKIIISFTFAMNVKYTLIIKKNSIRISRDLYLLLSLLGETISPI